MSSEILEKIQKLSPTLKAKLSDDLFLDELDKLETEYGIKVIVILLKLLLKELSYAELESYLMSEYNFNQVLAIKIKEEFGRLIVKLAGNNKTETNNTNSFKKENLPVKNDTHSPVVNLPQIKQQSINPVNKQQQEIKKEIEPKKPIQSSIPNNYNSQNASPAITFFREDEEEIKKYQTFQVENKNNFNVVAREIAEKFNFNGKDQDLNKRLENIILSRFKEIRDVIEFKEILMKKRESGGLEFTEMEVDNLLEVIKKYLIDGKIDIDNSKIEKKQEFIKKDSLKPIFEEEDGLPVVRMPQSMVPVDDYLPTSPSNDLSKKEVENKILPTEPKNGKINKSNQKKSFLNRFFSASKDENKKVEKNIPKEEVKNDQVTIEVMPQPQPAPYISNQKTAEIIINNKNTNKPSLDDVKFQKQTSGPIEELENMTLIEFRRISADPRIAVNKIKEKIDLLEKQNFQKKIQAILAWQKSEVNKFYRLLGQASMSEGKPIEEIIRTRLFAGKPTLSLDEFEVILELNKQLRF